MKRIKALFLALTMTTLLAGNIFATGGVLPAANSIVNYALTALLSLAGGMSFAGKPNDEPKAAAPSEGAEAKKPLNLKILSAEQKAAFGDHLFAMQCSACHGLRGPMLDIRKRVKGLPPAGIDAIIAGQGTVSPYMPPFFGKAEERALLAQRLADLAAEGGDR